MTRPALRTSQGNAILHYAAPRDGRYFTEDELRQRGEEYLQRHPELRLLADEFDRRHAAPRVKKPAVPKPPKSDSPWMDKHGLTQDVLNKNALAWWDTMSPQQIEEAHHWYPAYHDWANEMADRAGIHPHKAAGVVAATSPLRRWDGNLQDAHNFLTHYPHSPELIKKPPGLSAGQNLKRAQRVYDAPDDPAAIRAALSESKDPNSAKKILSFHDLGVNPEHGGAYNYDQQPVVIDSWMPRGILVHPDQVAAARNSEDINLVPPTLRDRLVKKVRKQNPQTKEWEDQGYRDPNLRDVGIWALSNKGGYDRMANALRHVAQQRGLPFAHVAQAGIWNQLGGTANPETDQDTVATHENGPLTHIQDPNALYDAVWNRRVKPQRAVALADPSDYEVDDDWDHLRTPHSKIELDVAHGRRPHVDDTIDDAQEVLRQAAQFQGSGELKQALQFFPDRASGKGWFSREHADAPLSSYVDEVLIHNPQLSTKNRDTSGPGWLEGNPVPQGPGGERQWREVKYDAGNSRFYHPDTGEDVGDHYEWAHARPDSTLHVALAAGPTDAELQSDPNAHKFFQDWFKYLYQRNEEIAAEDAVKEARRVLREALDYHSPDQRPTQLRDLIPTDHRWLDEPATYDQVRNTDVNPPTGKWYHTSPYKLEPGTKLVPGGGQSPDDWYYDGFARNRPRHVWVSQSLEDAKRWQQWAGHGSHIYEVHPGDRPQPWNFDGGAGFVVPHARIKREVQT